MQIQLQDFVPYRDSLKWKIHGNYFRKKGAQAWLGGDVPYDITCNSCAAHQNAALFFEAVKNIVKSGDLAPDEPVNVVEFASGVGLFAINFIRQFRKICDSKNVDYAERLVYYFTDFSENNLRDAMERSALRELKEAGVIKFAVADAVSPQGMRDAITNESLGGVKFCGAVANYLHCVLPLTILRKQDGKLFEKYISMRMDVEDASQTSGVEEEAGTFTEKYIADLFNDPTDETLWPKIKENSDYRPIEVETFFKDMNDFKVIEDSVKYFDTATVIYPYGSFNSIKNFSPMMKRGAIYVISDKGYADCHFMHGANECLPSLHGNSFAHSVNFPLLDEYAKALGLGTCRTYDPSYSLQTLVVEKLAEDDTALRRRFNELFNRENPNQDSSDFMVAAWDYEKNNDFEKALIFLKKALAKRPFDAKVYYRLGNICYDSNFYHRALDYYVQGKEYDYFNLYDFDFCIGQANFCMGQFAEAIPHYMKSIGQNKDNPKYAYVNIGLCNNRLEKFCEAGLAFKKALELDPAYARARLSLEGNSKRERL